MASIEGRFAGLLHNGMETLPHPSFRNGRIWQAERWPVSGSLRQVPGKGEVAGVGSGLAWLRRVPFGTPGNPG